MFLAAGQRTVQSLSLVISPPKCILGNNLKVIDRLVTMDMMHDSTVVVLVQIGAGNSKFLFRVVRASARCV